jgi:hypothetical protein
MFSPPFDSFLCSWLEKCKTFFPRGCCLFLLFSLKWSRQFLFIDDHKLNLYRAERSFARFGSRANEAINFIPALNKLKLAFISKAKVLRIDKKTRISRRVWRQKSFPSCHNVTARSFSVSFCVNSNTRMNKTNLHVSHLRLRHPKVKPQAQFLFSLFMPCWRRLEIYGCSFSGTRARKRLRNFFSP